MLVKIWLDDIRDAPNDYIHVRSVNNAKFVINQLIERGYEIELDLDHDLGDYASDGGDAIYLVRWLAENEIYPAVKLHTMNPVVRENMQAIIDRYWPKSYKRNCCHMPNKEVFINYSSEQWVLEQKPLLYATGFIYGE